MIPVRLQIKGFLSYYDPVDIDFTGFDMACISGSNGAGKSSLLDAITWVLFGEARRNDDAVINHRTQSPKINKPAEVIMDFDYENARYRVQRMKFKGKTTTLDFFIRAEDENWRPLTEATLRATEEHIRQTLRLDYETFINASFFLQGKADQFAQQRP
ncbi:MAG: AAA family ATPase, partial [Anaerolineaceae bacterium]|nr:AAA family ATPase [Anaerolineaceae bacterium]